MKTLLIDAGNSSLKWASLKNGELSGQVSQPYENKMPQQLVERLLNSKRGKLDKLIIASVLDDAFMQDVESLCKKNSILCQSVKSVKEMDGLKNAYDEPEKLGVDRFVAMLGARFLYPDHASIIIDIGTAATIDAVKANGQHLGGLILPGSILCRDSLLKNTALLEKWSKTYNQLKVDIFSTETTQAIASASVLGLAGAIESIVSKMKSDERMADQKKIKTILCGGGAEMIIPYLESDFNYHKNLLMVGLQAISQCSKDSNA